MDRVFDTLMTKYAEIIDIVKIIIPFMLKKVKKRKKYNVKIDLKFFPIPTLVHERLLKSRDMAKLLFIVFNYIIL